MDYSGLLTAVENMLASRTDLTAEIPTYVAMAEGDFNLLLRCREMETRATASSDEYISLPTDYLELRDVQLNLADGRRKTLQMLPPSELDRRYSTPANEPEGYAIVANQIQLAPPPDATYTVEIIYYAQVPALSGGNTSNWLIAKYPNVYLYQTLMYAMTRAQFPELAAQWGTYAKAQIDMLNGAERRQRWSGPPLEVRPG